MEATPRAAHTKWKKDEGKGRVLFLLFARFLSLFIPILSFQKVQRHWRKKAAMYGIMSLDLSLFRKNGRYRTETWHIIFFFSTFKTRIQPF